MTGEMCKADVTRDEFPIHFAIADALGGTVEPFDVYQGPYIRLPGTRLFIGQEDDMPYVWKEDGQRMHEFWPDDIEDAIEAARVVL